MPQQVQTIRPHSDRTGKIIREAITAHARAVMASTRAAIDKQIAAAMAPNVAHGHRRECLDLADQRAPLGLYA
jgi:hypothetical protein